jgi:hypothetical protein
VPARPLLLALLALPCWSACALGLLRVGGRRLLWGGTVVAALALAAWAGSRVGTANPVSRFGRWDPLLAAVMAAALLAIPGLAIAWGVLEGASRGLSWPGVVGAGTLAGLAALPVAFVAAVAVEVIWPH